MAMGSVSMAAMPTASINDLPDSAFAYIEPGGKKDESGKTVPRSLRHFPIHDAAHVRNALARMSQSPHGDKAKAKIMAAAKKFNIKVSANEDGDETTHFGFIVDLGKYKFDEEDGEDLKRWIQAFPIGKWDHPEYGTIEMSLPKAVNMAANINAGVRGQDLDIDYDHKADRKDAAGWIERAEARVDGLWVLVDWTKEAFEKIKNKAYKYFSPEFMNVWTHPSSGQKFKDVLFGGALTNRPHLKGILPINLSEFEPTETIEDPKKTERELLESIAAIYNVQFTEDTTDIQLKDAIAAMIANLKKQRAKKKKKSYDEKPPTTQPGAFLIALSGEEWGQFGSY
jgi:hypothetical protein